MMFIAGCSGGGHSVGSAPPSGGGSGPSSLTNGAKVTVSIAVAQKTPMNGRRINNKVRPQAASKRAPAFISPSTSSIAISAVYNGAGVFTTTINLSQCTDLYSIYQCSTSLPVGTYTLYTNLYDGPSANGNWLGTNLYLSPAPQTIYANGAAPYGNYLYADVAGIAQYVFIAVPNNCTTTTGSSAYAPIYAFDADANEIVGPLANPLTGYVSAGNGVGLGAVDLYESSTYGVSSADHNTIYDTSLYQLFVYEGGPEGSGVLYGATYNLPAYFGSGSNGAAGFQLGSIASPAFSQLTVGTYIAVAMTPGNPVLNAYDVQESVPAIASCNSFSVYPSLSSPALLGTTGDSSGSNRNIIIIDGNNIDMMGSGNPVFYVAGGVPQAAFTITSTYTLGSNETPINLFTSPDAVGRFFVITNNSNNSGNGQADQFLATSANTVYQGSYQFSFAATTSTRIAGEGGPGQYALYYSSGSNNLLYGVDRTNGNAYPTITAFTSGTVYTLQPSGAGWNYIFFRGFDASAPQYSLCEFDPTVGIGSKDCLYISSSNSNPVSIRYDNLSGDVLVVNGTAMKEYYAHVPPVSLAQTGTYTFPAAQARFVPGEAAPGFVGVYDGTSTTTFMQWNGSSWISEGSVQWPNAWLAPLY
jgi:hypothetical protein